jgi:hypothetical protein
VVRYGEMRTGDYQYGFRSGRGTTEKAYEYNINLHVSFVDFKQASYSIKWIKIYEILQQTEMPAKLVRLIKKGSTLKIVYLKNSQFSKE